MRIDEYSRLDASGLAELIRLGQVTAEEVAACARRSIQDVNSKVEAILDAPDAVPLSHRTGPLAGVPFLIKDLGPTLAGLRSEAGSRLCEGYVPTTTSHLINRYLDAGLVVLGRTKSPEFGFSVSTEPLLYGPVRNPWNLHYSAGGSSGGSAAAVAAGAVPAAHANDAGGSIRIPAAFCGLVGLKPSRGRVSVGPSVGEAVAGLGADHVLTRTVRDTALLLDISHGQCPGDPYGIAAPNRPFAEAAKTPPPRLRIGVIDAALDGSKVDDEIVAAVRSTADHLSRLGHHVDRAALELGLPWSAYVSANLTLWCGNIAQIIDGIAKASGRPIDTSMIEPANLQAYHYGKSLSATDVFQAYADLNTVRQVVAHHFANIDVLLSPVVPRLPPRLGRPDVIVEDREILDWGSDLFGYLGFTSLFNATGGPAISLPLHQSSKGLPLGLQLAANLSGEEVLLSLAGQLEAACPWSDRRPPVYAN